MLELTMNRDDAWALLTEYTKGDSLLKHALGVEAAVRGYARLFGEDEEAWGITALLHDFDYERWPTLGDHPNKGADILREKGYPEWMIRAILSHAMEITGVTRDSQLEKTLFACDELAGFITAASLVRPSKSILDHQADEGQGVREGREARRSARRRGAARSPARAAHRQRDRLHAGARGRTRAQGHAVAGPFGSTGPYITQNG
jgi:putative nucleotidyltransferase with HDIG domain